MDALLTPVVDMALMAFAGLALGLLPGLHVNTLAVGMAAMGFPAPSIIAAATSHAFASILPTVYIGAPPEDAALAALPAHRLLLAGHGRRAVLCAGLATAYALALSVPMSLVLRWVFLEPGRLGPPLVAAAPLVVAGVAVATWWGDLRRGRGLAAFVVIVVAGIAGIVATGIPVSGWVGLPATPLLPLLVGLFAVPGMLLNLAKPHHVPWQAPSRSLGSGPRREVRTGSLRAVLASMVATVAPGLTPGTAAVLGRVRAKGGDIHELALVSGINTAHLVFTLAWLALVARPRTGLTQVLAPDAPVWSAGMPVDLFGWWAAVAVGGLVGWLGLLVCDAVFAQAASRATRPLAGAGLAVVLAMTVVLAGPMGIVILVASAAVGWLPFVTGVRRLHLTACLVVPFLLRAVGWPL